MKKTIPMLKSFILTILLFVILTMISAVAITYTGIPLTFGKGIIIGAMALSTAYFGIVMGNIVGKRGLLVGVLSGLVAEMCILALFMMYFSIEFSFENKGILYLAPMITAGLGGIVGANLNNS